MLPVIVQFIVALLAYALNERMVRTAEWTTKQDQSRKRRVHEREDDHRSEKVVGQSLELPCGVGEHERERPDDEWEISGPVCVRS